MSRVDELQKKYPTIPREVIIKWDVLVRGVRDSGDIDKLGGWMRAGGSYIFYDQDLTMKEYVEKRPENLRPGLLRRPPQTFFLKNGIATRIGLNTKSTYQIREETPDRFALYEGEERVEEVYFLRPKARVEEEPLTSKGTPLSSILVRNGERCFFMVPVRHCEYFNNGEQCKFCNFNPAQEDARAIGLYRPTTINLDEAVEAYKIRSSEAQQLEGRLDMGGFKSGENEMKVYCNFLEALSKAAPDKPNLTVHGEAIDSKDLQRLKDSGLDCYTVQIEIWEPNLFAEICPGKARRSPHERWVESMQEAVDVLGAGNVGCGLVGGLTMIPSNGHKTWQESRDSLLDGVRWMVKNGIMPDVTMLRLPPGSVYGADPANRQKRPPTEYALDFALGHHEACMETGFYEKLNKFLYCGLCDHSQIYCGELGMLALSGDLGNWMSDVVPSDFNWLAKFISSVKAPEIIS